MGSDRGNCKAYNSRSNSPGLHVRLPDIIQQGCGNSVSSLEKGYWHDVSLLVDCLKPLQNLVPAESPFASIV